MELRLLEIELYSKDPEASRKFYHDQLGLNVLCDQDRLKVFDVGIPGVDFDKSSHFPEKISISFYAEDIQHCVDKLTKRGVPILEKYGDPLVAIVLEDSDGCRVEIKKHAG